MTVNEKYKITDLKKCNFKEIDAYFKRKSEERKARSKQEKLVRSLFPVMDLYASFKV